LAKGEEITSDTSTLENPAILEQLKEVVSWFDVLDLVSIPSCIWIAAAACEQLKS
jgi:hypothetical protein